jgi:hypothetical protein
MVRFRSAVASLTYVVGYDLAAWVVISSIGLVSSWSVLWVGLHFVQVSSGNLR